MADAAPETVEVFLPTDIIDEGQRPHYDQQLFEELRDTILPPGGKLVLHRSKDDGVYSTFEEWPFLKRRALRSYLNMCHLPLVRTSIGDCFVLSHEPRQLLRVDCVHMRGWRLWVYSK